MMSNGKCTRERRESHFPADGSEACSNLGLLVGGYVNLEIGQGMEVVEQAPVLPTSRQSLSRAFV